MIGGNGGGLPGLPGGANELGPIPPGGAGVPRPSGKHSSMLILPSPFLSSFRNAADACASSTASMTPSPLLSSAVNIGGNGGGVSAPPGPPGGPPNGPPGPPGGPGGAPGRGNPPGRPPGGGRHSSMERTPSPLRSSFFKF